ncbi:MAG: hypothetical protein WBO55_16570 [Rhizobiaceae bacterium]
MKKPLIIIVKYTVCMLLFGVSNTVSAEEEIYLPIKYSCPTNSKGNVEILRRSKSGAEALVRVSYLDGEPQKAIYSKRNSNKKKFAIEIEFDPRGLPNENGKAIMIYGMTVYGEYCQGDRYDVNRLDDILSKNRAILGLE